MSKPLEGIRIIEIAQEIQGPFADSFPQRSRRRNHQSRKSRDRRLESLAARPIDWRPKSQKRQALPLFHRDEPRKAQYHH